MSVCPCCTPSIPDDRLASVLPRSRGREPMTWVARRRLRATLLDVLLTALSARSTR